jgi:leucyl aminopeptidase (aminopeptidase T)
MSKNQGLISICQQALEQNLEVQSDESVLIVTDSAKRRLGEAFQKAALARTGNVELIEISTPEFNGQEPSKEIALKMRMNEVVVVPLTRSISWTRARKSATDRGTRFASLPGITEDILCRTIPVDYYRIRRLVNRICDLMDEADSARITTELGTDIFMDLKGRFGHGRKGGIYAEPGHWGNLPCGEAFVAPVEGRSQGVYVLDASLGGVGRLDSPVKVTVKDGLAVAFEGGEKSRILQNLVEGTGSETARNIAELGIGCNHAARITGITLEDEKSLGTCHIALGSNAFFGGLVEAGIHLDGVITAPTIYLDDTCILKSGKLVSELVEESN